MSGRRHSVCDTPPLPPVLQTAGRVDRVFTSMLSFVLVFLFVLVSPFYGEQTQFDLVCAKQGVHSEMGVFLRRYFFTGRGLSFTDSFICLFGESIRRNIPQ
ncbi:unnamed protein product [Ectocarpus sp. 12 AP-2014]